MGTSCSKSAGYKHLSQRNKDKLNTFLEELVTKAGVDFSCPEIQDIQSAVSEMIERIKTGINKRGRFSLSRIEPCGSMAEKTAMWKRSFSDRPYIEFDFLAVLKPTYYIKPGCKERFWVNTPPGKPGCQECFWVNTPPGKPGCQECFWVNMPPGKPGCQECFLTNTRPVNLGMPNIYYLSLYNPYLTDKCKQKEIVEEYFTRETNNCLASCGCQEVKYPDQNSWWIYTFEPSSTCSKTQQGCDKCTVDRPTGTLRVKTSEGRATEGNCTLIFQWTSKAKTLCTRDWYYLPETEKMDNLIIRIDFLPALEVFQSKQQSDDVAACSSSGLVLNLTSSEYEHYCFLVPKRCVVCDPNRDRGPWRRSGCRAEIDTFVNKMSDKHRKCYQVLKYVIGLTLGLHPLLTRFFCHNSYHLKIAVLHHNSSCSDAGENCAECVFKVLDELQHAYETKQLKSLHSETNLFDLAGRKSFSKLKGAVCSAVTESDSVSSFLKKVKDSCRE